jgi:dolichyl-phosphate-mannose-protein mannosyltransferase
VTATSAMPALPATAAMPAISDEVRRFPLWVVGVTAFGFLLRIFLIGSQPVSYDDWFMAHTAANYVERGNLGPIMWNHPGLGNLLVYGCLELFGRGAAGLKGASLAVGTLSVPALALVARRLTGSERAGLLAALFWAIDPLSVDFSRQAVQEIYMACFPLAGIWFALRHRESGRPGWLAAAGVSFGLGLCAKWSVLVPLLLTCAYLVLSADPGVGRTWMTRLATAARLAALLVVLPALLYLVSFTPWFGRGYGITDWPALQASMGRETATHQGHRAMGERDHRAYAWFLRPVSWEDAMLNRLDEAHPGVLEDAAVDKKVTVLKAVSNPLVWLAVLPALAFTLRSGWRSRRRESLFLCALFLGCYLPLALTMRRQIALNAALSVLPFALMMVGLGAVRLADRSRRPDLMLGCYAGLVLLTTAPLYLLAIGRGTDVPLLGRLFPGM